MSSLCLSLSLNVTFLKHFVQSALKTNRTWAFLVKFLCFAQPVASLHHLPETNLTVKLLCWIIWPKKTLLSNDLMYFFK